MCSVCVVCVRACVRVCLCAATGYTSYGSKRSLFHIRAFDQCNTEWAGASTNLRAFDWRLELLYQAM